MHLDTVRKKINKLIKEKILLEVTSPDAFNSREIMLNKDYSEWLGGSGSNNPVGQMNQWVKNPQKSGSNNPEGGGQTTHPTYIYTDLKKRKKNTVQAQTSPRGFEGIKMLGDDD
jgi:hypothetical protein